MSSSGKHRASHGGPAFLFNRHRDVCVYIPQRGWQGWLPDSPRLENDLQTKLTHLRESYPQAFAEPGVAHYESWGPAAAVTVTWLLPRRLSFQYDETKQVMNQGDIRGKGGRHSRQQSRGNHQLQRRQDSRTLDCWPCGRVISCAGRFPVVLAWGNGGRAREPGVEDTGLTGLRCGSLSRHRSFRMRIPLEDARPPLFHAPGGKNSHCSLGQRFMRTVAPKGCCLSRKI